MGRIKHFSTYPRHGAAERVYIKFDGVSSAFYLWINGKKVGYSQDSRTPATFDITDYIKAGRNSVSLEVYQYSDGSYLEDQDFWRLSGIFRNVSIYTLPNIYVADVFNRSNLTADYKDGTLLSEILVKNKSSQQLPIKLKGRLYAPDGLLWRRAESDLSLGAKKSAICKWQFADIRNVKAWSAETPNLYTLVVEQTCAAK